MLSDRLLDRILKECEHLENHQTRTEYCVYRLGEFRSGSIWIRPKRKGYRVQTTGAAQSLDSFIGRIVGTNDGSYGPYGYRYWSIVSDSQTEKILQEFNRP